MPKIKMRIVTLIILTALLNGCAKPSASESIANSATNTVNALEQTLSKDCATDAIKSQITAVKSQINAITEACESEKAQIKADKVKWQTAFFGLLLAIAVFIIKKVLK